MEDFKLSEFCARFLEDKSLGTLAFFKDHHQTFTYADLIQSVLGQAQILKEMPEDYLALKMESSYNLFIHLLAGSLVKKDLLILSHKEPDHAVLDYQKNIGFKKVITDSTIATQAEFDLTKTQVDMNRPAFNILSSGSSGPSKAIGLSLNNVFSSAQSFNYFFEMSSSHTSFLNLPHHHIGGLMILWRAFLSCSSVTKNEEDTYEFISLVPLQLKRFLQISSKKEKLQNCLGVLIGGAPLSEELKREALKEEISIYETYGMSETSSMVMLNGIPLEGQTIKLDAENHFLIKGPTLSPNAKLDSEGFFHTKDIGRQNADGSFSFIQRSDVLFKSAGELINPLLIEEKIKQIPWIVESVVVAIDHPEWTRASVLVYKTNDPTKTALDIKDHLKQELHPHLIPRYFYEAPKNLINEGMKPKRFEISKWAQEKYFQDLLHYLYIPQDNSKKLMVFFHGFMEDHTDMIPLMDNHKEVSYLFIDLPGHGKSEISHFSSREQIFTILASLINFLKVERDLILYGYSMGGRIALELAATSLKASVLFLESAHFGLTNPEEKRSRLTFDRQLLSSPQLDLNDFFKQWYRNPIFATYNQSPHYYEEISKKMNHDPIQWQASLEFFSPGANPFTLDEMLAKIKSQKIIGITGSDDEKYKTHYLEMNRELSHFNYYEIAKVGHNPHKTHLSEIKNILREFI